MGRDEPIAGIMAADDLVVADQLLDVLARLSRLLIETKRGSAAIERRQFGELRLAHLAERTTAPRRRAGSNRPRLEHGDGATRAGEPQGGGQACEPAADYSDVDMMCGCRRRFDWR